MLMSAVSMTSAPRRAAGTRGHSEPGGQGQAFYSGNRCPWQSTGETLELVKQSSGPHPGVPTPST